MGKARGKVRGGDRAGEKTLRGRDSDSTLSRQYFDAGGGFTLRRLGSVAKKGRATIDPALVCPRS
jgi:hypothetical protein